ncbi:unnamed protein product [Linum tenue]|uniref:Uncharacterized protein n=1 Tax=Linum tenue TaxID=586396 RepID=A0AAV0L1L1_9ROSI|nr:unnamed protein product [Linum tenue]
MTSTGGILSILIKLCRAILQGIIVICVCSGRSFFLSPIMVCGEASHDCIMGFWGPIIR